MMEGSRAALYIRVSTEEQAKYGFSIDAQLEALNDYCSSHFLRVYRSYIDAGKSGKSILDREQLKRMLEDAKLQRFQHVIVWRLSRLSRSLPDLLNIVERLSSHDVALVSLNEQFDTHTPLGKFTLQMMGAAAQLERDQIAENVRLGAAQRVKQGKWNCGNSVLGYRWSRHPETGDRCVEIVPHEAEIVLRIFNLYSTGTCGYKAITNILNKEGFRTKKGGMFHVGIVRNILMNVNYIGKIRYDVKQNLKTKGAVPISCIIGDHQPIITTDLWNRVQDILQKRTCPPRKLVQQDYPLTGLLKCPQCEQGMVPQHTKAIRKDGSIKMNHYYACGNYLSKGITACKPNSVRADDIEKWVFKQLQAIVGSAKLIERIAESVHTEQSDLSSALSEQAILLQRDLKQLEVERKQQFEAYEKGTITKEELKNQLHLFQTRSQQLQTTIDDVERQLQKKTEVACKDRIHLTIRQINEVIHSSVPDVQRPLLGLLIDKITLPPDRRIQEAKLHTKGDLGQVDIQLIFQEVSKEIKKGVSHS